MIIKPEEAINIKDTPPAIPIAQRRMKERKAFLSLTGRHPMAVSMLPAGQSP